MTGWKLFKFRLLDDWKYQRKVLSTVVNWTVWIYIFIPFAIFAGVFYWEAWRKIDHYWLEFLPHSFVIFGLLLFTLLGKFRTYMQEPDQLFLLDKAKLYQGLRAISFFYSSIHIFMITILGFVIAFPWLVKLLGLGIDDLLFLFVFLFAASLLQASVKRMIFHQIKRRILVFLLYIFSAWFAIKLPFNVLFFVGAGIILLIYFWQLTRLANTKKYFFQEVNEENKERVRYAQMILGLAQNVEKTPIRLGKRPIFLRKSKRLFKSNSPEDGLMELLLKGFLRHSVYRGGYLRLVAITAYAVLILPIWLKWLVFILFALFLNYNSWLKGLYEKLLDQSFFSIVPVERNVKERVWLRFKRWLMFPAVSIIGLLTIMMSIIML